MREVRLRDLTTGRPAAGDRIALLSIWSHGHNNPRYAELLPRLERLDACLLRLSDRRVPRGLEYRAFRATRPALYRAALRPAAARYRGLLTLDPEQIAAFAGPIVADVDDPYYTERHARLLADPRVKAYVVTAERAARDYEAMGVATPWHVVPQGVSLRSVTPALRGELGRRKAPGEQVVGWMAAHLLTAGDRDADGPLYNVDHLLELWEEVHARVPASRLWLVGGPSDRLRRRVAGRDDILLLGRLPRDEALAAASHFDLAVYARTEDTGIRAAKVGEFIGLGVPTVSYDYEVTANLRESGAGVLVGDRRAFVDAVVTLLGDEAARGELAASARRAGRELDWDVLARRFEDVLDRYLPRVS